ncbi:flagella associated protein [Haematococcus lacustris]
MNFNAASLTRQNYNGDTTSPQIRTAGIETRLNESAADALNWDKNNARPPTPPELRKYRTLTQHIPGVRLQHYGAADDKAPEGTFGVSTKPKKGEDVPSQLTGVFPTTELGRWHLEEKESIYASSKLEPLGKGMQRGTRIPDGLGTTKAFGMRIDAQEKDKGGQIKHVMFPTDQPPVPDDEGTQTHSLYLRSHGDYMPGEQRRRNYDWDSTQVQDPAQHRFGLTDKDSYREGVRKALQPGLDQSLPAAKAVITKLHEDHKLTNVDQLGAVKKLGTGDRGLGPDHAYGMPSLKAGMREPGVDELFKLNLTLEQQQPDADLGKSLREGYRNIAPEGRTFGVPSIRTDIPKPAKASVSNMANYGNEPDAFQLLRPPRSVVQGVGEQHYLQLRGKEEVRSIAREAEIVLSDEEFDTLWNMSVDADGEQASGRACLDTFFRARHYMLGRAT